MKEAETMSFSRLRKLCFCNSKELHGKVFLINDAPYEWVGIGMLPLDIDPDPEKHVTIKDD